MVRFLGVQTLPGRDVQSVVDTEGGLFCQELVDQVGATGRRTLTRVRTQAINTVVLEGCITSATGECSSDGSPFVACQRRLSLISNLSTAVYVFDVLMLSTLACGSSLGERPSAASEKRGVR